MTKQDLGLKLRKIRLLKGWSQNTVATDANTEVVRISEIELGKKNLTLDKLLALCDALGVEIELVPAIKVVKQKDAYDTL